MKITINRAYALTLLLNTCGAILFIGVYIILKSFNIKIPIQILAISILLLPLVSAIINFYTLKKVNENLMFEKDDFNLFIFKMSIPLQICFSIIGIIMVLSE